LIWPAHLSCDYSWNQIPLGYSAAASLGFFGLAAAVVGRSDVVYERGFGYDDIDRNIVTRSDSPMHLDGLTEMFSASLVMRCVEQGRLSLDNIVGQFKPSSSDANLTLRQVLTHTGDGSYSYRPDRLGILQTVIRACTNDSFRETLANLLDENGMALILVTPSTTCATSGPKSSWMRSIVVKVSSTTSCSRPAEIATTSSFRSTRNSATASGCIK
jgi:hypothetical protein